MYRPDRRSARFKGYRWEGGTVNKWRIDIAIQAEKESKGSIAGTDGVPALTKCVVFLGYFAKEDQDQATEAYAKALQAVEEGKQEGLSLEELAATAKATKAKKPKKAKKATKPKKPKKAKQ
jgi:hypothetical protein